MQATGGRRFRFKRIYLKLPEHVSPPKNVSESEALRRLAAGKLGRPWTIDDPSLFTYHYQWIWDLEMAQGEADTLKYKISTPPRYEELRAQGQKFPLYVHLHGSGARRLNLEKYLSDPFLQTFQAYADKGMVVVTPLRHVQWQAPAIAELLERLEKEMAVDSRNIWTRGASVL